MTPPAAPTLEDLRPLGEFQVAFTGGIQRAPITLRRCVYSEWTYGDKEDGEWREYRVAWRSEAPFTVRTPVGSLEIRPSQARLYLSPVLTGTFGPGDAEDSPALAEALVGREQVDVDEYTLEAGSTYHARVAVEVYRLRPLPGEPLPQRREVLVLEVSSSRFDEGQPRDPLTPACRGRTY